MKTIRKGLGKGKGSGYYNLVQKDPYIHSLSARGVKTYNPFERWVEITQKQFKHYSNPKIKVTQAEKNELKKICPLCSGQGKDYLGKTCKRCQGRKLNSNKDILKMGTIGDVDWNAMSINERRKLLKQIEPNNKPFVKYFERKRWDSLGYDTQWHLDGTTPISERRKSEVAFEKAIKSGRLSNNPKAKNYIGNYMWMGKQFGKDQFKNDITREYLD